MAKREDISSIDIQKVLLDMREYRMGLIQTPDQLRFSYMAVIEGARLILKDNQIQVGFPPGTWCHSENNTQCLVCQIQVCFPPGTRWHSENNTPVWVVSETARFLQRDRPGVILRISHLCLVRCHLNILTKIHL